MKDNTLRGDIEKILGVIDKVGDKDWKTDQLESLLAEEVRKAIEKIAQENTVNFFGIQEGSDISTKKKWVQVIKTQDILEQLEKEGK